MPQSVGHPDIYFSHMLVNNMTTRQSLEVIDDAIRITNQSIFIYGFEDEESASGSSSNIEQVSGPVHHDEEEIVTKNRLKFIGDHLRKHHSARIKNFDFRYITMPFRSGTMSHYMLEINLKPR